MVSGEEPLSQRVSGKNDDHNERFIKTQNLQDNFPFKGSLLRVNDRQLNEIANKSIKSFDSKHRQD